MYGNFDAFGKITAAIFDHSPHSDNRNDSPHRHGTVKQKGLFSEAFRAENGTRTRGPQLGKLMLYHLSYFRTKYSIGLQK